MDVIDYDVFGNDMQYVEIELDPGEAAIGEAGMMMFMQEGIEMETIFGDGSAAQSSLLGKLMGAGKRLLSRESLFTTVYLNQATIKRRVAFSAPYPGKIVPVNLAQLGGTLICQKEAFLCAAKGVSLGVAFQRRLGAGFFGGEGFILQKLEGDGMVFFHACGTLAEKTLAAGETLRVDTGCVAVHRQCEDRAVWRRRTVPGPPHWTRQGLAAIAAVLAPGQPDPCRRSADRHQAGRGRWFAWWLPQR
jgi:uncharacterized protein (AIM24 family)